MTMVTQSAGVVAYKPKTISKSTILSEDKKMSLFVGAYYLVNTLNLSLKIVFPISESLWRILSVGFAALLAGLMLFTIKPVLKRSFKSFFIAETIFVALYCISFFQGNADLSFLAETAFWTLGVCIPLACYVHSVSHKNILYETLLKYSYFLIAILSWVSLTMLSDRGGSGLYNMSLSYALALPVILQFNEFIEKQRVLNLVVTVVGVLGILLYGARGPLVCVATFFLLKCLIISKTITIRKIGIYISVFIFTLFLILYFRQLLQLTLDILARKGIYSRTLYLLGQDRLLSVSGRDSLWSYYWTLINEKPVLGWGVLGGWLRKGSGPHNMIIEIMLSFGVVIGGIITLLLLLSQLRVFFVKDKGTRNLLVIYMAMCIVLFFVSGNMLQKPDLFIFLTLVLGSFKNNCLAEGTE